MMYLFKYEVRYWSDIDEGYDTEQGILFAVSFQDACMTLNSYYGETYDELNLVILAEHGGPITPLSAECITQIETEMEI